MDLLGTRKPPYNFDPQTAADPRLNPGEAERAYVFVKVTDAWVFQEPTPNSARLTQLLFGEACTVHRQEGDFYLIQSLADHYCGWVHGNLLQQVQAPPRDFVWRTRFVAPVTREPDMKSALLSYLAIDSQFAVEAEHDDYLKIPHKGWIHRQHAVPHNKHFDIIETARLQIGRSYVWGGRGMAGLDCSALAQLCYRFAGYNIPRDADLQHRYLAQHHLSVRAAELQAGDLIFTPGHVMLASSANTVIHANAHHMRVVEEPLKTVIERLRQTQSDKFGISAHRWKS